MFGLILAGGEGRRLGGKPFRLLGGRPLIVHVIERVAPQLGGLTISVRGDPAPFVGLGLPIVVDEEEDSLGPLAGIAAGLAAAKHAGIRSLAVLPCDAPFLPSDLVSRLAEGRREAPIAVASYRGRMHPVLGLWDTSLAERVDALLRSGERRLASVVLQLGGTTVAFDDLASDPFVNVNSEDDLRVAERRLASA